MEKTATGSPKIAHSLLLAIPILLLGIFASMQAFSETDMPMNIATILTIIYFVVMFVFVVHTRKTDKYRAILFISIALSFPVAFTNISCLRCAKCIDARPKGSIYFHIRGTRLFVNPELKRKLFLYPAFFIALFVGVRAVQGFLYRIITFVTTGSFIHM